MKMRKQFQSVILVMTFLTCSSPVVIFGFLYFFSTTTDRPSLRRICLDNVFRIKQWNEPLRCNVSKERPVRAILTKIK